MSSFCLSQHAGYRCQHSGACCTSNWPIHVEAERVGPIRQGLADGRVTLPADGGTSERCPSSGGGPRRPPFSVFLEADDLPPGTAAVLRTTGSGACVFYDGSGRRCAIHRDLGPSFLPSACQHFPRRCLIDRDAVRVSLSHYCPTVAQMAFTGDAARGIVATPDSLVGHVPLEGLDAREVLPPLLRPGMLTDLDGYHAWERAAVEFLEAGESPEAALERIREMTERAQGWSPQQGSLAEAVHEAAAASRPMFVRASSRWAEEETLRAAFEVARSAIPGTLRPAEGPSRLGAVDARWIAPAWLGFSRPIGRFLAAHAFGSWCAYLGAGLSTVLRSLDVSLAVVRVEAARRCAGREQVLDEPTLAEAFRAADLLLVHLADPRALAAACDRRWVSGRQP
jgi:Fe-S-cluster containining protein